MAKKRRQNIGFIYILPWLIGFLLLQLYPFALSFYYSFTDTNLFSKARFVGFQNYINLFTIDPDFKKSLWVTLLFSAITVTGKIVFALFIAVVLSLKIKGIHTMRALYYLPSILGSSVAIAVLWRLMFMHTGVVNQTTGLIGIDPIDWLGHPSMALFTISSLEVWQFGSSMVLFLAALKQVPAELYEAAKVDGARPIRTFFTITIPMISPIIFFNTIMQTINALQNFTAPFIVTAGGPVKSTYLLALKIYEDAFTHFKIGYASASSWILFLIILIFTLICFGSSRYWVHYGE